MSASKSFPIFLLFSILFYVLITGCAQEKPKVILEHKDEVEFKNLEFREDGLWYQSGANKPFTGTAVRFHENGIRSWSTHLDAGIPKGRVREWDQEGKEIWP